MENSNFLHQPEDSLIFQMRVNHRGRYCINGLRLKMDGLPATQPANPQVVVHVYFRYIDNGIIESEWQYIGASAQKDITISTNYVVPRSSRLQIKLIRKGEVTGSSIELLFFRLDGNFIVDAKPTPTLDSSMFAQVNNQEGTAVLENNLFKKLYFRGILPNYILRGANISKQEDGDFISLFSTIARFFAIIMRFFKRWENTSNDEEILKEILRNNGIQFDEVNITLEELQMMTQNLYNEISKRGTKEVFRKLGDIRPDGTEAETDGELMRVIRADNATEVLYETIPNYESGWCLGKSSPMYRGISNDCLALDKMDYEDKTSHKFAVSKFANSIYISTSSTEFSRAIVDANDTLLYGLRWDGTEYTPDLTGLTITIDNVVYELQTVVDAVKKSDINKLLCFGYAYLVSDSVIPDGINPLDNYWAVRFSGQAGLGRIDDTNPNDYLMKVDAYMDYEIVFAFKCRNTSGNASLKASVEGFSVNRVKYLDAFILPDKTTLTGDFFYNEPSSKIPLNQFQTNEWYYVRFIIKAYGSERQDSYTLNIGRGNELHFNNAFIRYILPTIYITSGTIDVCNYHIRPLVRGTNINCISNELYENSFSLGFLRANKIFHLYLRNRNTTVTKEDVEDCINHYLLPYSSANILTFIE